MKKKTNPRRIPLTQSDVDRAKIDGVEMGLRLFIWTLIDKHDISVEEIQQFTAEVNDAADSIAKGYIKWSDIEKMLSEDYDVVVKLKG